MPKAFWNGEMLAQSNLCRIVEGNYYFPPESIRQEFFKDSDTHTTCQWKGVASYYHVEVHGEVKPDAAWYYPEPTEAARNIAKYVAFWKGIEVVD